MPPKPPKAKLGLAAEMAAELGKTIPISTASSDGVHIRIPGVLSTRCPTLDAAIGRGGLPFGRLSIVAGIEAGGKTTLALHCVAEALSLGGTAVYADMEHKLDLDYAGKLGVDLDSMLISQPNGLEDCFSLFQQSAEMHVAKAPKDAPYIGILDSLNAARTKDEFESDYSDHSMSPQARFMSANLPKLLNNLFNKLPNKKIALLFISQPRENIGGQMVTKNLIACGAAPKFYASLVIELRRAGFLTESEKPIGTKLVGKIVKNQVAVPFKEALFNIRWGEGIDYHNALFQRGIQLGLLNQGTTGWYEMLWKEDDAKEELLKWQGQKSWNKVNTEHPGLVKYLETKAREMYK